VAALRKDRRAAENLRRSAVNRVGEKGQAIMIFCLSKIENQWFRNMVKIAILVALGANNSVRRIIR